MPWARHITSDLPPPQPEEPADLRRDILDELSDHLQCALRDELKRTDDETAARRTVLDRFGDPAALARRLWRDAMKEQLMNQRIMLITNIILALTVIAALLLTWRASEQNRAAMSAILTRLENIEPAAPTGARDWLRAEGVFTIRRGSPDGPPVPGVEIRVSGELYKPGEHASLWLVTDENGQASTGNVWAGLCRYSVQDEEVSHRDSSMTLRPGRNELTPFVLPEIPTPQPGEVRVELALPPDLDPSIEFFTIGLERWPRDQEGPREHWTWDRKVLLVTRDGRLMAPFDEGEWPFEEPPGDQSGYLLKRDALSLRDAITLDGAFAYRLDYINAFVPVRNSDADDQRPLLVRADRPRLPRGQRGLTPRRPSYQDTPVLHVALGDVTTWGIEIPDWMPNAVTHLQEYFAAREAD